MYKAIISLAVGASALFATAASAAPLSNGIAVMPDNGIENVRMVCNEYGRCWRERGQRRVIVEDSYNYAPRERYIERRGYYDGGYYNNGPSVGIGVGPGGVNWLWSRPALVSLRPDGEFAVQGRRAPIEGPFFCSLASRGCLKRRGVSCL